MSVIHIIRFPWNFGELWIRATENGICEIQFDSEKSFLNDVELFPEYETVYEKNAILVQFEKELTAYFNGKKTQFITPVEFLTGTEFQQSVWKAVNKIPYGQVYTYKQIAKQLGNPNAVRAVGAANGANPVPILVPCHRVIQSDGKLGGYAGGLAIKDALLRLEGVLF